MTTAIQCEGKTTREINRLIRDAIAAGQRELQILQPDARHNLAVALLQPVRLIFDGVAEELFPVLPRLVPKGSETLNFVDYTASRIVRRLPGASCAR